MRDYDVYSRKAYLFLYALLFAARVVQRHLREDWEKHPRKGFFHVIADLSVPAQSAVHLRPFAIAF